MVASSGEGEGSDSENFEPSENTQETKRTIPEEKHTVKIGESSTSTFEYVQQYLI